MSKELDLAKRYFDLSNESDFSSIENLFTEDSTFCSRNIEYFIGVESIMDMQRAHHGSFKQLNWIVNTVSEIQPGVVCFDFDFDGLSQSNKPVSMTGLEYVIVKNNKILHIDVRNK
ncbi:MAG: hypothetical protein KAG53_06065 [Endozoicomonadaceae bacterium]|nr:hypothetical protein [Endozoicomonadaceae bacterium]